MEYSFIKGKHDGCVLLYSPTEKDLYVQNNERNGKKVYVCYQSILSKQKQKENDQNHINCKARVTINEGGVCERNKIPHSDHENHEIEYLDLVTRNAITDKCRFLKEHFPESAHKIPEHEIFMKELSKRTPGESRLEFSKMKRQLSRIKSNCYPKKPTTFKEIKDSFDTPAINLEYGRTLNQTEKLYVDTIVTVNYSFCIFASFKIINIVKQHIRPGERNYLLDGTFKVAPEMFYQLLIISIEFENDIFPMFYVLMSAKSAACYEAVFRFIEYNIFELEPGAFMTDFEAGMRKAIRTCFPRARLNGCWFHYCSAVRKKCLQLGMHGLLNSNPDAKLVLNEIMSIPLLPPNNIKSGFSHVMQLADSFGLSDDFKPFFDYYEMYWISQNDTASISVHGINMRTNSSSESLNSKTNRTFPKHPHIFKFAECLRIQEFSKATDMHKFSKFGVSKKQLERKRKKDKERDSRIKYYSELFKSGDVSVGDFLEAVSNKDRLTLTSRRKSKRRKTNRKTISGRITKPRKAKEIKKL